MKKLPLKIYAFWNTSIQKQLMLGIILVHAVLMTIFVFDLVSRQKKFLLDQNLKHAESLARSLALNSSSWVLANDVVGLEEVIDSLSSYPNLKYAMILDFDGRVISHTDKTIVGKYVSDTISLGLIQKNINVEVILVNNSSLLDVAVPIITNDSRTGWARVGIGKENINTGLWMATRDGIFYTILAIIIGIVFAYFMGRGLTSGLHHLVSVTEKIRKGDRMSRSMLQRNDELGYLGNNLNQMLDKLIENENRLYEESERIKITLEAISDAVITTDTNGKIRYVNDAAETLLGIPYVELSNMRFIEKVKIINTLRNSSLDCVKIALETGKKAECLSDMILQKENGEVLDIEVTSVALNDQNGSIIGSVTVIHDITVTKKLTENMERQAKHDSLTGLINRAEFERRMNFLLEREISQNSSHVLLYLDLDQFKIVNDTCGHMAGDVLLKQLTLLLQESITENSSLARLGGDEFGILMKNATIEDGIQLTKTVHKVIQDFRFFYDNKIFKIGVSTGIVLIDKNFVNITNILAAADMACYSAKEAGRNTYKIYRQDDHEIQQRQGEMEWVSKIHDAMNHNRMMLFCQNIVPLNELKKEGFHIEFLLRMKDANGKIQSPGAFIQAAERFGKILEIDQWVFTEAVRLIQKIIQKVPEEKFIASINLSGPSLGDEKFHTFVISFLNDMNVSPERICFEITETAAIQNLEKASYFIRNLKENGFQFSLDDFGSGLSSFGYLKNLPVDYLKIDGSFVRDIVDDPIDRSMVSSINEIGHVMNLKTIAEFVENDAIKEELIRIGVDFAQGYGIQKPIPFDEWLDNIHNIVNGNAV